MSTIFGSLGINDNERVMQMTAGENVIYDFVQQYVNEYNADLNAAMSVFVDGVTSDYKERYKSVGGGFMSEGRQQSKGPNVKPWGDWDVAYPLKHFEEAVGGDDVAMAYMTAKDLDRAIKNITLRHKNSVRYWLLYPILHGATWTFTDELHGALTIEPLANGDSVLYPPVWGATDGATENHYLVSGYAASGISDTNDPYVTIAADLKEHFGTPAPGGMNMVVFINSAQVSLTRDLSDFVDIVDNWVKPGDETQVPQGLPAGLPGTVIGRHAGAGVWVIEWPYIPANYLVGVHLEAAKPLKKRIDPADTGLGQGLQIVTTDTNHPFSNLVFRDRFGFGVSNRINGVVMQLAASGSYTAPSGY